MITRSSARNQQSDWTKELRDAYVDPLHLLDTLKLTTSDVSLPTLPTKFAFRVPRPFVARMRRSDPSDPLLLQVLPQAAELTAVPGFELDPVGDLESRKTPALLHKYNGRALLITTGGCAINCRYCFRRHFPYAESAGRTEIKNALSAIEQDPSIHEIILSGGDPLMLQDHHLAEIIEQLGGIAHLRRIRIHTRLPVTIPARITDELLRILNRSRLTAVVVVHINHAAEIDVELAAQLQRITDAGVQVLNQSVLLHGINDDDVALVNLSEALFAASVLPYYVHLLDPVAGASHFKVDDDRAYAISAIMRSQLPGYLVPRFVREIAGEASKTSFA